MTSNGTPSLRIVPKNNVVPFVPKGTGYIWHCHEVGCPVKVHARYEAAAAYDIARHWTDEHDPKDAA